jgi:hypothetical protein
MVDEGNAPAADTLLHTESAKFQFLLWEIQDIDRILTMLMRSGEVTATAYATLANRLNKLDEFCANHVVLPPDPGR